jgi:hypothetical protein
MFVAAAVGVSLLAGVVLALALARHDATPAQVAAAPAVAPTLPAPVAAPASSPVKTAASTATAVRAAASEAEPSGVPASTSAGARPHPRASRPPRVVTAVPAPRRDDPPVPSAKPKAKRAGLDDSEPDVGY